MNLNPLTLFQELTHLALKNPVQAVQTFQKLAEQNPILNQQLALELALFFETLGQKSAAKDFFYRALATQNLAQPLAWQLRAETLPPILPQSLDEIAEYHQELVNQLTQLPSLAPVSQLKELEPYLHIWKHLSFLSYLGLDPLPYRQIYGQWFQELIPTKYLQLSRSLRSRQRRVGWVLNATTAAVYFYGEFLKTFSPQGFELLYIFTDTQAQNVYAEAIAHNPTPSIFLNSEDYSGCLDTLLELELDFLFLTEANTDRLLQTLMATCRLAPLQLTSVLSAGTTGLPSMDLFLSGSPLEKPNDQRYYSEKLLFLPANPVYVKPVPFPDQALTRQDFGLPECGTLYLCPHLLFKFHPEFDFCLGQILRQDPQGFLVCTTKPDSAYWRQKLLERFEKTLGDVIKRIWFLPHLTQPQYLALLNLADLILDPLYFGGGTTTYEALALGVPILTCPSQQIYSRFTAGAYRQMGLENAIVSSPEAYIKQALVMKEPQWNQTFRQAILQGQSRLFSNQNVLQAFQDFFQGYQLP